MEHERDVAKHFLMESIKKCFVFFCVQFMEETGVLSGNAASVLPKHMNDEQDVRNTFYWNPLKSFSLFCAQFMEAAEAPLWGRRQRLVFGHTMPALRAPGLVGHTAKRFNGIH